MIHYVTLNVSDLERSGSFYDAILAPLGWRRQAESAGSISWGMNKPALFVSRRRRAAPGFGRVSFPAKSIPAVKASYESGMASGGEPVAEPGQPRPRTDRARTPPACGTPTGTRWRSSPRRSSPAGVLA